VLRVEEQAGNFNRQWVQVSHVENGAGLLIINDQGAFIRTVTSKVIIWIYVELVVNDLGYHAGVTAENFCG
jgi:hypothetical protein